jgi:hypothetical protein
MRSAWSRWPYSDVEVCRLLVSLVFSEIGNPPAHHSGVEDTPDARADMASIEPHG